MLCDQCAKEQAAKILNELDEYDRAVTDDKKRLDWLEANTYAIAFNHETGKGFIRFSRDHDGSPYGLRKAIDEAMEKERKKR